jgi:predicted NBD/HSP70 family sugar kinase
MYTLGIEVHKRESHIAVLDEDGEVVEEVRVDSTSGKLQYLIKAVS